MEHCQQTRARIRLAVAAWAYEVHDDPILTDAEFDALALSIDVRESTSRPDLDEWFRENFNPSTGMWVHNHPETTALESIYRMIRRSEPTKWEILISRVFVQLSVD